jgi:hypothetical protein
VTDRQLIVFYCVFFVFGLALTLGLYLIGKDLSPPQTAEEHADKVCQALYGPQTQAVWNEVLQCQTRRGEVLPVKKK